MKEFKNVNMAWPVAVVLGLGQNGMATVRALGRAGVPIVGIDRNLKQYCAKTKYCQKVLCPDFKTGKQWLDVLVELGKTFSTKGVLFPSGDIALQEISNHRAMLQQFYHFTFPDKPVVDMTLNKKKFYQFAMNNGFPIPKTFFPESKTHWNHIAKKMRYPCIVKPFQPNLAWRLKFPDQKLFKIKSEAQLIALRDEIVDCHGDLIIQESIPGNDQNLYFSLAYIGKNGHCSGLFVGKKIRQYPPHYGTSSLAQSCDRSEIALLTNALFKKLNYTGYGSVEFKWDPRDEGFKIIEVTARTWFPHGIAQASGLNLEYIAYCDTVGFKMPTYNAAKNGIKWVHEERDLRSCLAYFKEKKLSMYDWVQSYRGKVKFAIFAADDLKPGLYLMMYAMQSILRSARRKIVRVQ